MDEATRERIAALLPAGTLSDDAPINLVAPIGRSVAGEAAHLGLDPAQTVGVDPLFSDQITIAGASPALCSEVAATFASSGNGVTLVGDGPAMPAQRLATMLVLIGADAVARGIGTPADIDAAARRARAYPKGPLELGDAIDPALVATLASRLHVTTGDPRWRPSSWLDACVKAGRGLAEPAPQPAGALD
jgi:3-hydroxybutyryl-CoA dehydrogenase